eukprot:Hpha_TRINITY_DN17758_c0_g1::TRINITY_DN17758_c0_g1_i1::g.46373::m.46373/K19307/BMT5; 25S rRNA (uracil2634-N3)-methyltransferase
MDSDLRKTLAEGDDDAEAPHLEADIAVADEPEDEYGGLGALEKLLQEQMRELGDVPESDDEEEGGEEPPGEGVGQVCTEPPPVGSVVETTGLSVADLNGLQGRVIRHQADEEPGLIRAVCDLHPHGEKALRPSNLKLIEYAPAGDAPAAKRFRAGGTVPGLYEPAIKYWDNFTPQSKILVVGEGNFSWAWNLCHILGTGENLVCTDAVMNSTVATTCDQYLIPLIEAGATITMRLDATRMGKQLLVRRCGTFFDFVVWNYPHTTTPNRARHSQEEHRQLLTRFLQQAELILTPGGRASITVKDGYPYNEWRIGSLVPGGKMKYVGCEAFTPERWQVYAHVTTRAGAGVNGSSQIARVFPAHTYVYEKDRE